MSKFDLLYRPPVFSVCEQQKRRPACASAKSGQRLCYSVIGKYHIKTYYKRNFIILAGLRTEEPGLSLALSKIPACKTGFVVSKPNYNCVIEIHLHFTNTFKNEHTACLKNKLLKTHGPVILLLCCHMHNAYISRGYL